MKVLLRGNHENVNFSVNYLAPNERHYYQNEDLCIKLQKAFTTMPLACAVGTKTDKGTYEYTLLTHGAIDPDIDLNRLLKIPLKRASIPIRREKKADLSDRIQDILPDSLKSKKNSLEFNDEMQALKDYINEQSEENLSKVKSLLGIDSIDKKQAKLFLSILNVKDFLYSPFFILDTLLPESLQNLPLDNIDDAIDTIQSTLGVEVDSEETLQRLAEVLELKSSDRQEIQNILELLYLKKYPENNLSILSNEYFTICKKIEVERADRVTNFNWGDIDDYTLGVNNTRNIALMFTPEFLKHYFRVVSTDTIKVKTLRAGHSHKHRNFRFNGKTIAETLPVSGGLKMYETFSHGIDYAQIITINRRVKEWLKQSFQRYPDDDEFTLTSPKPCFYQKEAL